MAQNISPDRSQSSNLSKQNDEAVTIKDNHAVSKRLVAFFSIIFAVSGFFSLRVNRNAYKTKSSKYLGKVQ